MDFVQIFFIDTYGHVLSDGEKTSQANIHVFAWENAKNWKNKNIGKIDNFQMVVTSLFVDRNEWSSYQKKGKNL